MTDDTTPSEDLCSEAYEDYFSATRAIEAAGKKMHAGLSGIDEASELVPEYLRVYASILEQLGRVDSAEEAYLESVRIACSFHDLNECCYANFILGKFYIRQKRYDEAFSAVQHPNREDYRNPELLIYIEFLSHAGKKDRNKAKNSQVEAEKLLGENMGAGLKKRMRSILNELPNA